LTGFSSSLVGDISISSHSQSQPAQAPKAGNQLDFINHAVGFMFHASGVLLGYYSQDFAAARDAACSEQQSNNTIQCKAEYMRHRVSSVLPRGDCRRAIEETLPARGSSAMRAPMLS
jgi:hypothetical protein